MDFQLYSLAAALVFSQLFFAADDAGMAVIGAMATYGVGYVARPVGAWFFGRMGDRIGRKKVLFYTIVLMGLATTLIGVLPTYETAGLPPPPCSSPAAPPGPRRGARRSRAPGDARRVRADEGAAD